MDDSVNDADVGKRVEDGTGTVVGEVVDIEQGRAIVDPDTGVLESIRSAIGWRGSATAIPVESQAITHRTDDVLCLETDDESIERAEGTGQRDAGAGGGHDALDRSEPQTRGKAGDDRDENNEDGPPHGDQTVTTDCGREDDR